MPLDFGATFRRSIFWTSVRFRKGRDHCGLPFESETTPEPIAKRLAASRSSGVIALAWSASTLRSVSINWRMSSSIVLLLRLFLSYEGISIAYSLQFRKTEGRAPDTHSLRPKTAKNAWNPDTWPHWARIRQRILETFHILRELLENRLDLSEMVSVHGFERSNRGNWYWWNEGKGI